MLIIGDVHGKLNDYQNIIEKHSSDKSIQIGDFGFKKEHDWHIENIDPEKHKILFGNHDYYPYLNKPHSLGNFAYLEEDNIFCIRGAYSIDQALRLQGHSWFDNEELTYSEFQTVLDYFESVSPDIVITHDCPDSIRKKFFGIYDKSITSTGLQACLEIHQPKLWIFGHHHQSIKQTVENTEFVCLAELEKFFL